MINVSRVILRNPWKWLGIKWYNSNRAIRVFKSSLREDTPKDPIQYISLAIKKRDKSPKWSPKWSRCPHMLTPQHRHTWLTPSGTGDTSHSGGDPEGQSNVRCHRSLHLGLLPSSKQLIECQCRLCTYAKEQGLSLFHIIPLRCNLNIIIWSRFPWKFSSGSRHMQLYRKYRLWRPTIFECDMRCELIEPTEPVDTCLPPKVAPNYSAL